MQTIADILKKAKLGDILTNNKLYWKVTDLDYDGSIVAVPINEDNTAMVDGFELWSTGVESVAVILDLRIVGESLIPNLEDVKLVYEENKKLKFLQKIQEIVWELRNDGISVTSYQDAAEEFKNSGYKVQITKPFGNYQISIGEK